MVDNIMIAHGRNPYARERKIFVALGDPINLIGNVLHRN
jgi:hypothetical protein